jgi:extracellular factor (EF) 3-hydroxypalmitic acid methyl ester biosynthesis protein
LVRNEPKQRECQKNRFVLAREMFHPPQKMNMVSNGNGSGTASPHHELKKKAAPARPVAPQPQSTPLASDGRESRVTFQTAEGVALRGTPLSITRHAVIFELYNPAVMPKFSEAFGSFTIALQERAIYSGRAVIRNVMDVGTKAVCEATLDESSWLEAPSNTGLSGKENLRNGFSKFVSEWQKSCLVIPEYKLVIADLQTFLADLRLWLDRVESGIRSAPAADQAQLEVEAAGELRSPVLSALSSMFERFEMVSQKIPSELQSTHRAFGQRQLHPYLLCAPFINRTYTKPMGYAGDYEMMNMIVRNGLEGSSLFAKLVNSYLLDQAPAHAVRGRVNFLNAKIAEETGRISRLGKTADIFCVACGPAWEAVNFIAEHPLAERARFHLLDFSEETLQYTRNKVDEVRRKHHRTTQVKLVKNSVQNLLRAGNRTARKEPEFDLVYCSGLYDYLSDSVCVALNTHLHDLLKPGGLLVTGNFAPSTPIQNFMEHFLEWFLIYRDARQMATLAPEQAAREDCAVRSEPSGTNIFLEVRKPQ